MYGALFQPEHHPIFILFSKSRRVVIVCELSTVSYYFQPRVTIVNVTDAIMYRHINSDLDLTNSKDRYPSPL